MVSLVSMSYVSFVSWRQVVICVMVAQYHLYHGVIWVICVMVSFVYLCHIVICVMANQYKQGFYLVEVKALIEWNLNLDISRFRFNSKNSKKLTENLLIELLNQLFENINSNSVLRFGEMSSDIKKFNFSERAQTTFGKIFNQKW